MPEVRFGPYVLVKRIAVGGMAEVYLARYADGPPDAHVVVKQILPQLAEEPELLQLFIDEARIASRVVHPGIVRVLDVGVEGGVHFLAMEYVDGLDGSQLMRLARELHGNFPVPHALRIIIDLCRGLHHAHEATEPDGSPLEIVHRDVSPQNILISRTGHVKLTDFGIARARIRARRTATGVLRGKIAYVSPEQYLGDRGDRRVDVYAIGVVLFEMLAGRRPFNGDEATVIREVMTKDSPSLISVLPDIDPRVSRAIDLAIARHPDHRIKTAADLADDLEDLHLACSNDELGTFATKAIALRDRSKQSEQSSPGKAKPTRTLNSAVPTEQPKQRTQTLPVPVPSASDKAETEINEVARDTWINPVVVDDDDEGDTVYSDQRPQVVTAHRLKRVWPVRTILISVIAFGFIAGWFVSTMTPGELSGQKIEEEVALVKTTSTATIAATEPESVEEEPEEEFVATIEPVLIEDLPEIPVVKRPPKKAPPPRKKRVRERERERPIVTAPAAEGFGELSIDTDPWSRVRFGKTDLGPTPLAHVKVPAGRHRFVLENSEKGITRSVILTIKSDELTVVRVRLSDGQIVNR